MPRGTKTCPSCSAVTGPRAFKCPQCGYSFAIKARSKPLQIKSTPTIKSGAFKIGDKVKLIGDWLPPEVKGKRGTIERFQTSGEVFAIVHTKYVEQIGTRFPLHELELVE